MSSGPLILGADDTPAMRPQGPAEPSGAGVSARARRATRAVLADRRVAVPLGVIVALVLFAIFVPIFWSNGPDAQDLIHSLQSPSTAHPMGTDQLGRDVFARFADGARISLLVASIVTIAGALVGGLIGLLAGTIGGFSDGVAMRAMDAILAFPPLILAMAVTVGLGIGLNTAAIGVALVSVPWYARLLRSEALRIRSLPFIEASYAIGMTRSRVISRHVIPHMLPVLFIQMAAAFGYAVLGLASLSFVGLGAQVPTPEWGAMITEGLSYSLTGQWWISIFPGVGLLITVTAASMLSDRMRDLLDPRGEYARL
ncbi:MAG TPA: ABC transporter permease [Solirubrobacteraceae bacterium]|jgi:peptide/nickel transport system permease protein|nr:ABC transporter permease [Solirubrobacteraceae bacterium]